MAELSAPEKEEQLRRLVVEYRLMQGSAETLQQRFELLQTAMSDLNVADLSLKSLKDIGTGTPALVPVGGNTFVSVKLGDLSRVIVGIGANVSVEMEMDKAIEDISSRLAEVEKANQSVQQQLEQIVAQMQVHQEGINRLGANLRGEAPRVR